MKKKHNNFNNISKEYNNSYNNYNNYINYNSKNNSYNIKNNSNSNNNTDNYYTDKIISNNQKYINHTNNKYYNKENKNKNYKNFNNKPYYSKNTSNNDNLQLNFNNKSNKFSKEFEEANDIERLFKINLDNKTKIITTDEIYDKRNMISNNSINCKTNITDKNNDIDINYNKIKANSKINQSDNEFEYDDYKFIDSAEEDNYKVFVNNNEVIKANNFKNDTQLNNNPDNILIDFNDKINNKSKKTKDSSTTTNELNIPINSTSISSFNICINSNNTLNSITKNNLYLKGNTIHKTADISYYSNNDSFNINNKKEIKFYNNNSNNFNKPLMSFPNLDYQATINPYIVPNFYYSNQLYNNSISGPMYAIPYISNNYAYPCINNTNFFQHTGNSRKSPDLSFENNITLNNNNDDINKKENDN